MTLSHLAYIVSLKYLLALCSRLRIEAGCLYIYESPVTSRPFYPQRAYSDLDLIIVNAHHFISLTLPQAIFLRFCIKPVSFLLNISPNPSIPAIEKWISVLLELHEPLRTGVSCHSWCPRLHMSHNISFH